MAFTKITKLMTVIASLGTKPQDRPLTTDQFKAKFDEESESIKGTFNTLIDDMLATTNGKGASQIGLEDSATRYTATNVETALAEIAGSGRTTETVKSLADLISNLAGVGRTTETVKSNADNITGKVSKSGDTMSGTLNVDAAIASRLAGTTTKKSTMKYDATYDSGVVSAEDSGTRFKPITVVSDGFKYRPSVFSVGDAYNFFGTGTALPSTTGSMTAAIDSSIKTITPTGSCTFNASGGITGQDCTFIITTSGITSYTLTFGTNFKTTGTLATGVSSGKVFAITFRYDGTNWVETGRTAAM